MPDRPTESDKRPQVFSQLDTAYPDEGSLPPRSASAANTRRARFGFSMILIGIIAILGGAYPIPIDLAGRLLLMIGGLAYALIGAWQIQRANRELHRSQKSFRDR